MNRAARPSAIGYFGKIPSRGDFVKGGDNPALIKILDDWLAEAMDLMSADARWKLNYDAMAPLRFAIICPRRPHAVVGHIVASSDQSQRRFPFLMMAFMDVACPGTFVPAAPLVLNRIWHRLASLSADVINADDATAPFQAVAGQLIKLEMHAGYEAAFDDFLSMETIGAIDRLLAQSGFTSTVRQVLLALGLLLKPVMDSGSNWLEKSLLLPLPSDPMHTSLVATFWLHVITPFLMRADFELALFITHLGQRPVLVLGFSGVSPKTLCAIMDPQTGLEHHVALDELDWVEERVNGEYATLSTYLAQANLSLKAALDYQRAAFIGS